VPGGLTLLLSFTESLFKSLFFYRFRLFLGLGSYLFGFFPGDFPWILEQFGIALLHHFLLPEILQGLKFLGGGAGG
jgi:hypothetical protein